MLIGVRLTVTFGNTALDRAFLNVLKIYNVARQHLVSHTGANDHKDAIFPNLTKTTPTLLARGAAGPIQGALDLAEYFVSLDFSHILRPLDKLRYDTSMVLTVFPI